jgi:hypothetical protein
MHTSPGHQALGAFEHVVAAQKTGGQPFSGRHPFSGAMRRNPSARDV